MAADAGEAEPMREIFCSSPIGPGNWAVPLAKSLPSGFLGVNADFPGRMNEIILHSSDSDATHTELG